MISSLGGRGQLNSEILKIQPKNKEKEQV